MKKRSILLLGLCAALVFSGCKKEEEAAAPAAPAPQIEVVNSTPAISISFVRKNGKRLHSAFLQL